MSQPLAARPDNAASDLQSAFEAAAKSGQKVVSVDSAEPRPAPALCDGCGLHLDPPVAFAPLTISGDEAQEREESEGVSAESRFCANCRATLLGPPCAGCSNPVARDDGLIAADAHWHRRCLRCAHGSCGTLLGDRYFLHDGLPYCRTHYLDLTGEVCGSCGLTVDGGLRALGRVWHEECLTCAESGQPLSAGQAFLHEGRAVAPDARLITAPRCHACREPAVVGRVYAHGCVYHADCFRCVHCKHVIGERKFVIFDGEPYLDGCYQKLFGASAGEALRTQIHGTLKRHAIAVPLLLSLGAPALQTFRTKHEELLPQVRRVIRQAGIVQFASFLFEPPLISKPSLVLHMLIPTTLDADDALPSLLQDARVGQQWMDLLSAAHDTAASRGNPWWANIQPELGVDTGEDATDVAGEPSK
jgi:L-rhamnose mutarotase